MDVWSNLMISKTNVDMTEADRRMQLWILYRSILSIKTKVVLVPYVQVHFILSS